MPGVKIRDATNDDAAALAVLLTQLGYRTDAQAIARRMERMRAEPGQRVLVAEVGGEVVGTATVLVRQMISRDEPFGRLTSVVVLDGWRSRGIGQRLVQEAEQICRDAGCALMEVTSGGHRDRAHEFYRRLGYEERPQRFMKSL